MSKLTAKEKGILTDANYTPCTEPLPKTAFTEWLKLDDSANTPVLVDIHGGVVSAESRVDSKHNRFDPATGSKLVVYTPARKERTNKAWLENELKSRQRRHPDQVYEIVLSPCGKFGCLCKYACTRNANRKKV